MKFTMFVMNNYKYTKKNIINYNRLRFILCHDAI